MHKKFMKKIEALSEDEVTQALTYAGFILVAFELVKSMIVNPVKLFYSNTTFGEGMLFKSYEEDVLFRHKNQFEACLLYLRDFMKAIDSDDLLTIQALREHRNDLSHILSELLPEIKIEHYIKLLDKTDKVLFKPSNYWTFIEVGSDPELQNKGVNWETLKGHKYMLFEEIINKVKILKDRAN